MTSHSNIGGIQHDYLGLVVSLSSYTLLTNNSFVIQFHTLNLRILIEATRHDQEELKRQYKKNQWIFNETRGVERALIQKLVLAIEAEDITAMRNSTTGQLTGTLFIIIQYLIFMYEKISPIQLINL